MHYYIIMKFITERLYNQEYAVWVKRSLSLTFPLCPQQDSTLHILSECQHTQIRNMITERHNLACNMIFKAISKTGSLGSCFVCMDIGSRERLAMQNLWFPIQLKLGLNHSGSSRPASQTKTGLPPSRSNAVLVAPIFTEAKNQQTASNRGGVDSSEWQVTGISSTAPPATTEQPSPESTVPKFLPDVNATFTSSRHNSGGHSTTEPAERRAGTA